MLISYIYFLQTQIIIHHYHYHYQYYYFYMRAFVQFADALKYVVHLIGSEWGYFEEAYKRSFEAKTFQLSPFSHSLNEYHSSCSKILASLHEFSVQCIVRCILYLYYTYIILIVYVILNVCILQCMVCIMHLQCSCTVPQEYCNVGEEDDVLRKQLAF